MAQVDTVAGGLEPTVADAAPAAIAPEQARNQLRWNLALAALHAIQAFAILAPLVLQYRRTGRWADYLHGERVPMFLSLFAKTLLAWQVFAGTLRP